VIVFKTLPPIVSVTLPVIVLIKLPATMFVAFPVVCNVYAPAEVILTLPEVKVERAKSPEKAETLELPVPSIEKAPEESMS